MDRGLRGGCSCKGVVGVCGIPVGGKGGACGIIESRFNRRASVGLMVLAPRPVAWWGIAEILLFAEEDGVPVRPEGFPGVRDAVVDGDRE